MEQACGGVLTVVSSVVSNYGTNLQKRSLREHPEGSYHQHGAWRRGMACVVVGALGDFGALALASPAMVAALGSTAAMGANLVLSQRMHHERRQSSDMWGMALATAGAVLISVFSPPLFRTVDQLLARLQRPLPPLLLAAQAAGAAAVRRAFPSSAYLNAACSGVAGSFSVLLGSVVCLTLTQAVREGRTGLLATGYLWVPLPLMLVSIVAQVHLLSQALETCEIIVIYPVFQAMWTATTAISCLVLYGGGALMQMLGLAVLVAGLAVLRLRRQPAYRAAAEPAGPAGPA